MVLTEFQYLYVIGSVKKLRLTVSEKYQVHSPDDENRIMAVLEQLSVTTSLPTCKKCNGLAWSKQLLNSINNLIIKYENTIR